MLELPATQRPADGASTASPVETVTMPTRDLLGDGNPGGPARVIEVDTERWTPLKDAFRFEPPTTAGQPPKVTRPPAGGERIGVGYRLTVTEQDMHFALKLRLEAAPGVTAQEIAEVKARTVEGLQRYVNAAQQQLPGWDVPMRVTVDFDDPANARGAITVAPAGAQMSQRVWAAGASPAKYAHEIVHQLGVTDTNPPPDALLRGTHEPEQGDLMGSHPHDVDEFVLTPRALGQIAEVLSPYFSGSTAPRPLPDAIAGNVAEEFWAAGVDIAPKVSTAEVTVPAPAPAESGTAAPPLAALPPSSTTPKITVTAPDESVPVTVLTATKTIDSPLPGLYKTRLDLLYTPDSIGDLDGLIRGLEQSVTDAVRARVAENLPLVPGLSKLSVQTGEITQALRDDPKSFFVTGGRSFHVRDGMFGWHRVTVAPTWSPSQAQVIDQSVDKAKFDTRSDQSAGVKHASTTGGSGSLGVGTMFPQRVGYGAGGAVDVALSRPLESFEDGVKLTDSHNVRSGSGSHLASAPVSFGVVVTDPTAPLTGPRAAVRSPGEPVHADVTFRSVDDIAKAKPREPDWLTVDPSRHTSMLVENFTPVRILRADIGLTEGADPTGTWNDVVEDTLVLLQPTKAVGPGTLGAGQARGLFEESSMIGNLMPALDTVVHPPTITSTHGAHALSLELTAAMPKLSILADVGKTSFRWQPGQGEATKLSHSSRVGMGLSVVPARWAFGPGYVQARLFWGFLRSMTASATQGGASRVGTEFKDIPNVLVEAHFRVTVNAGLREVPGSRLFGTGAVEPITVDLVVLGHLPAARVAQLLSDSSVLIPSPKQWYVPPYALGGGRSVTYGLSGFQQLYLDVNGLIRRIEGGFLPEFGKSGTVKRMGTSRAAIERQANQDALDRVLTVAGLRQNRGALLKTGLIAKLSRTKKIGTRHIFVHVTASYTGAFEHLGTSKGDAVRTTHADTFQEKINAGGQWRGAVAFEGGGVFRLTGGTTAAFVPAGAVELRGRIGRQSGAQLAGQESRLNGGTPDSQAFGNDLQITVQVYAYTKRLGADPRSRVRFGRVMHQRLPRPVTAPAGATRVVNPIHEPAALVAGKKFTRFRLVETRPVTVQFDNASVLSQPISMPTTLTPRPDPLAVDRRTQIELTQLREWVDEGPKSTVNRWLSVEDFPGSSFILVLAKEALWAAQDYTDAVSRTKLGGLRGVDGLAEGMPVWASTIDRLAESRQIHGLASMLDGVWHVDRLTSAEDGAATDLAVAVALTNPKVLPAYANITNESASVGSVEISAAKTVEKQIALRANFSANVRRSGTSTDNTQGGGAAFPATYEKVLYAGSKRDTESISGAIERNANNRKGRQRSFLVVFDMRVSVATEITTDPDRYAAIPQSLRSGEWLHHHKSVARHGTITNAVFLRLSARTMVKLGLLPRLDGDPGMMGAPWLPTMPPALTLPPGRSPGLGLYTFDETPTLTESMTAALRAEAAKLGPDRGMVKSLLDMVQGRITNRSIGKISDSLSGPGLDDPMLNRRRLLYLLTAEGQAQHWPAMADGGVSVLHMKPGRMTQHSRDVRLIAEPTGEPKVRGFVADHEDLDIKTTHTSEQGVTKQRMHGSTMTAGAAGTGVSNHDGENLAVGLGDTVGRVSQVLNAQSDGSTTVDVNLSSGRGVKARLETPVKYTLAIFDKGKRVDGDLLVVHDKVVQDRWADDLRPPRSTPAKAPTPYRIAPPKKLPPGWRTLNGMPLPPRFSAEDLNQVAQVQRVVESLLGDSAKRLQTTGYAGAHQIHQSLTPEILLPGMPKLITPEGFVLPPAVSAQIFGQKAAITIRLLPESASLGGVSSGVYREHAPQQSGGYSTGTSVVTQQLRIPRIPLIGRGFADDPYQALESGGPGVAAGDTQAATESGGNATGDLGNVKPESRSAAVDYLSRIEVTVSLSYSAWPTRTVTSASQPDELVNVSLRMGLHDARTALHIPPDSTAIATDSPDRVAAFDEIVGHEAKLAKAAEGFVSAADKLDQARYDAYTAPEGSAARAAAEATLPGLHEDWDRAGQSWWELLQRHHQLLDDFRHRYLAVPEGTSDTDAATLAKYVQNDSSRLARARTGTGTGTGTTKQQPPAGTTKQQPPADTTGTSTGTPQVLPTPGGGHCQLYAAVGSAPELVSARLAAAGLGSPALHAWLNDPEAVRAQISAWAAQAGGLVPPTAQLGQAAELLRRLVQQHLETVGPDGVPVQALEGYRNNQVLQLRAAVDAMNRATLLDRLPEAGITRLTDPHLIPATQLRGLYLAQRAADLVAAGWDPAEAAAHAESQVPLKPTTDGSPPRDLADEALSMRAMFDYLTASGNPIGLPALSDDTLRDQLMAQLLDPLRPADADEFANLTQAVRRWEDHWQDAVGEAFPGLLAAALDARLRVHAPEHIQTIGREDAPRLDVYRRSDHYQAMVDEPSPPAESPPAESPPPGGLPAAELDQTRGRAVYPKGAKPFEIDPPGPADGKTVSGDALRTQQVRVNPVWMPLSEFTPEIHAGRPDARWLYVVTEADEIMIGSEEILTVVSGKQLADLHAAMRTKHPDLTLDQLKESLNQLGHATTGVGFDADGRAYVGKGRISGELHRDPETGRWLVDDKSGRYMSEKIRPGLDPADVQRWLDGVATRFGEQLGEPVEARPYKHVAPPPPPPPPAAQAETTKPTETTTRQHPPGDATKSAAATTAAPMEDLRARWVQFKAQRLQAEGTDPAVAEILAGGLPADRDTMLADLATPQAMPAAPATTITADQVATGPAPLDRTPTTTATATLPPGHLAPPGPDYRILRSADAAHLQKLHDEVSRLVATKTDEQGKLPVDVWWEIAGLITRAIDAPPVRAIVEARNGLEGALRLQTWIMELATDRPVDEVVTCLVHELTHLEQFSVIARLLATRTGDPAAAGGITAHPDVQRELWESRVTDDPRDPAMQQIWDSHVDPAARHLNDSFLQIKLLTRDAHQRLSAAERMYDFPPRALDRVRRGFQLLDAQNQVAPLRYNTQPAEMQAFLTQLRYTSLGSVRDWGGTPITHLSPPDGYELVGLGRAGGFLRPAGSAVEPPPRLAHPDRPLLVVSLPDGARADQVLTELHSQLPDRALVELITLTPISAARAMELSRLLGPGQQLALAPNLVEPPGVGLAEHFVSHSRLHTVTLPAFARYVTVHDTPQFPQLATPATDLGSLGHGRWAVFGDNWQATSVGDRVWVGPEDVAPVIEDGDPPVVIGVPSQDTPWAAWQNGMWLARMLAGQEGTPDAPIARVHRPEEQPPPPVRLDGNLVHAVTEQDAELARLVTGQPDPLASYEYSFPTPYPPLAVVPGQDLSFTVHHLIDALLDATDVAPDERDVAVLLDALTALAGTIGLTGPDTLRNLLAAGYLAARAYGIGGFGPRRLTAAYHALRLLAPTGPLASGPVAAADLLSWVDGVNVDTWATDLPVRLIQVLERMREPGVELAQLTAANQADAERIRLALDGLAQLDAGVWATSGVGPQLGPLSADGDLVLAYPAGPRLQPVPPGSTPGDTTGRPSTALLALLGDQARARVDPDGGRHVRVRLVPVTDAPITRVDFYDLLDDLADLNDRLGWRVVLADPVRADGSPVEFAEPAPEPPPAEPPAS
ncbi:hypothetical protein ACQPYA_19130 [Micromonospora sp. CA-263727]|uniref:hypothetical protein n=1 Tax=Micromonospora sp. CA-263727 TaxID=3239967 RepID=UPI003D8D02B7